MKDISIKVTIDGDVYSERQLKLIKFEREKYVLQEMIHLGAIIEDDGKILTFDDVNYLSYEDAERITLEAKDKIGIDGIKKLYHNELERSAQMWRDIVKEYKEDDLMVKASSEIKVEGFTLKQFQEKLAFVLSGGDVSVISEHPEHFQFNRMDNGNENEKYGIETMGMYGGPTEVIVMMGDKTLNEKVIADDGFLPAPCGTSRLVDGTLRRDIANHQMKPLENGFEIKTTVYFPKNTPKEMIEGHKLHLAMESYEMIKSASELVN
ncbi:Uncharacterised protein [[Clostridium] sordellii]|uniref:hypothetical protein n=1 Tax=Paraclostridium sordellii TaxID=1505 RepID=UPI0005E3131C|nr:hypothetical protein [Paeniclostridium sordellii]CEP86659.1 Uncharacterised protein [[Clostridium] sordellii] [Paeniclostridium sordellii]